MSHILFHVSHVTCHVSHVMCHMSIFTIFFIFIFYKVVKLFGGGSVIQPLQPVSESRGGGGYHERDTRSDTGNTEILVSNIGWKLVTPPASDSPNSSWEHGSD